MKTEDTQPTLHPTPDNDPLEEQTREIAAALSADFILASMVLESLEPAATRINRHLDWENKEIEETHARAGKEDYLVPTARKLAKSIFIRIGEISNPSFAYKFENPAYRMEFIKGYAMALKWLDTIIPLEKDNQ